MSAILDSALRADQLHQCRVADMLDAFIDSQSVLHNATVYKARVGSRKAFKVPADALAFESGWHGFHDGLQCPAGSPASLGWLEAERAAEDAREMSNDERRERAERS
jgi:hypothetical protein